MGIMKALKRKKLASETNLIHNNKKKIKKSGW